MLIAACFAEPSVDLGLDGKVALVAGGSSGLGLAVAKQLAAEGAFVAIGARNRATLVDAQAQIDAVAHGRCHAGILNIRDSESVASWVQQSVDTFGAAHIVVANAGGPAAGPATAFDLGAYRDAVELCLLGSINLVQCALPHLQRAGWGRILFVTSQSVKQPIPDLALSNVARPGLVGYAKSLVSDLGPTGITVNVLAPGVHRTPRLEDLVTASGTSDGGGLDRLAAEVPLGRLGAPEDFGAIAAFLSSEQAGFITGTVLSVDGGSTRGVL